MFGGSGVTGPNSAAMFLAAPTFIMALVSVMAPLVVSRDGNCCYDANVFNGSYGSIGSFGSSGSKDLDGFHDSYATSGFLWSFWR
jgi:hypothetical protein